MEKYFDVTSLASWRSLQKRAGDIDRISISEVLENDSARIEKYSLNDCGLHLDFSKNLLDDQILEQLIKLADESHLAEHRDAMFRGDKINVTEGRSVLHTILRAPDDSLVGDSMRHLVDEIREQNARIEQISTKIRDQKWLGVTGKPLTDVVNIGIGGSDLGPKLACTALKQFAHPVLRFHFVANVDGEPILTLLKELNPETTLFIVSSKTFTTQETLRNANTAALWLGQKLGIAEPFSSPHFVGVTASIENAVKLGFDANSLVRFWDWVGGRYSLWSGIGLAIAVAIGYDGFEKMRAGAYEMDVHFRTQPWAGNMPVILALLGIWYNNFLGADSLAVMPYCERLFQFPLYLQQLDMESNGKSVTSSGQPVSVRTGPIIWGLTGTNAQHSFFQLIHQGTHLIPVDFIGVRKDDLSTPEHHRLLLMNMLAQSAALASGRQDTNLPAYRQFSGNRPSNVLILEELTPKTLGALIALYEHKVFVQGSLWGINSFDQWGVELGKELTGRLLREDLDASSLDASTRSLLKHLQL